MRTDKLYFDFNIKEFPVLLLPVDIESPFVYSYGLLTMYPVGQFGFLDRFGLGVAMRGDDWLEFSFGDTPKRYLKGKFSLSSGRGFETTGFGKPGVNVAHLGFHPFSLTEMLLNKEPRAFHIPAGGSLFTQIMEAEYGIAKADKVLAPVVSGRSMYVYKGIETPIHFLRNLQLYMTDSLGTLGYSVYYDISGKGHLVSFMNAYKSKIFQGTNIAASLITENNVYRIFDTVLRNDIRKMAFVSALDWVISAVNLEDPEAETFYGTEWKTILPLFGREISTLAGMKSERAFDFGWQSELELECLDVYIQNYEFWRHLSQYVYDVTVPGFVYDDAEPGDVVRIFGGSNGITGLYAVLQKTLFVQKDSGFFTKFTLALLEEQAR